MKKLRAYYERELSTLHGYTHEFAAAFPAQAQQLGMAAGANDDPHVARFIQATALSNARIAQLIDDNDAKVTEALLSVNYPHYLRPFPAAAIVHADPRNGVENMPAASTIARGAMMSAKTPDGPPCRFRTVYDLHLLPVTLPAVRFHPLIDLPLALPRTRSVVASLSIDIACASTTGDLRQLEFDTMRCFLHAEPSLAALTRDTLFMRAKSAYLELPDGAWIALDHVPLRTVGFDQHDAMLPYAAASHPAYRVLTEYFAFPEKFNFFDIDWTRLSPHLPRGCRRLTLHLGLSDLPPDCAAARRLATLSNANFLLGCTPVINLFKRSACPIELTHTAPDYALMPEGSPVSAYDIYSIDKVTMVTQTPTGQSLTAFRPYYSTRHGETRADRGHYYLMRRDPVRALSMPGHETRIALVDLDLDPLGVTNASVSIDLTCTNRDLPSRLRGGAPGGDLELQPAADAVLLRLLQTPTPQYRFPADAQWRLISHLSLNHCSLVQAGLDGIKETLTLYDLPQSSVSRRQIDGLTGLEHRPCTAWLTGDGHSTPVHGIEVRLTLDEDAFVGNGLHLFTEMLDHFFGLYVQLNSFSQLTIIAQASGKELIRCEPRSGAIQLL